MSGGSSCSSEGSLNADDLLEIKARCKELAKEKQMLSDSKSQSFELIRRLEFHVRTLSASREEDKKHIEDLERELSNCCQEIDYLQDQLSMRNSEVSCLNDQICSLQLKLAENVTDEVARLREQMKITESERSTLMQEIEDKEILIRYSESQMEKLEESISSMGLEYQYEIESIRLESIALEQNLFETKKMLDQKTEKNSKMSELIKDLELQIQNANKVIKNLDKENKNLKEKLQKSNMNTGTFVRNVEDQFHEGLVSNGNESLSNLEKDDSTYGNILGPLFSKLAVPSASDDDLRKKVPQMSRQIDDYELLVKQLKEELREEKLKAKEEAEDLTQEMAELRYQLTNMLDEECKRRANIEQISLQRISELEAQLAKERRKSITSLDLAVRHH